MKLEFVNHSSFVLEARGVRLICDPWLDGHAFDRSWGLLSPSAFRIEDFARITHVWFSHEHPDHFHPPTLQRIPPEVRARITVLFQETRDRKVVEHCKSLGFGDVRELPDEEWVEIAPGVRVLCVSIGGFQDSWLCVRTPERTLLNLNDGFLTQRERIERVARAVGSVDVLATQFSISGWDGNAEELDRRRRGARTMLARAVAQCLTLKPRFVLPLASFVWFCHEENAYMNDAVLPIGEVERELAASTDARPVLLYPGDEWTVGAEHDNTPAIARYEADQASLPSRPLQRGAPVSPDALVEQSREFVRQMAHGSDPLRLRVHWARQSVRRARKRRPLGHAAAAALFAQRVARPEKALVHVIDHAQAYAFDPEKGLLALAIPGERCHVELTSAALHSALRFLWGGETLLFAARFREGRSDERVPDPRQCLFDYFHFAGHRNFGRTATWWGARDVAAPVQPQAAMQAAAARGPRGT